MIQSYDFIQNEKYGLSFISLHSPPEDSPVKGYDKLVVNVNFII